MRSPTGSWLVNATPNSNLAADPPDSAQVNGTPRVASPTKDPASRRDKNKRLSLAFFQKSPNPDQPNGQNKPEKDEKETDTTSQSASSLSQSHTRRRSKDLTHKESKTSNRLSWLGPSSSTTEVLPPQQQPSSQANSRSHSVVDHRPETGRSETQKSEKSEKGAVKRGSSVRKRLSLLNIGKKGSREKIKGMRGIQE